MEEIPKSEMYNLCFFPARNCPENRLGLIKDTPYTKIVKQTALLEEIHNYSTHGIPTVPK